MTSVVLGLAWGLWPVITLLGGQGFAPLAGLCALILIPHAFRGFRPRLYMLALLAFLAYAAASSAWSPRPTALAEVNLAEGSIAIRSEVARVGLLLAALGVLIAAAGRMDERGKARLAAVARVALLVQLGVVGVLVIFEQRLLQALTPLIPDTGEGVQNITRNSLLMAAAAPVLIALTAGPRPLRNIVGAAAGLLVVEIAIQFSRDVQAGVLGFLVAGLCVSIIHVFPRTGFRIIGAMLAVGLLAAPAVFYVVTQGADAETATNSAEWRLAIWRRTLDVILQHPIIGDGVGALRTMRERIPSGVFENQFYIPNHPHNMALQLWAETGAVGAVLLSAAILAAAWRLPAPQAMGRPAFIVAGLVGGMTVMAFVSFDLWNEWWWAAGGFLAVLAAATPAARSETEAEPSPSASPAPFLDRGHANNFNLLRLGFAVFVAVYHMALLSNVPAWRPALPALEILAEAGVQGFFVISGYLVFASLDRSASLKSYAEKRARRLLPAYAVVISLTALAALLLYKTARVHWVDVARYFGANIVFLNFLEPSLPGLFQRNWTTEVNGALWTLKIEILFYIILPALAWLLMKAGRARWVLVAAIYLAAELWRYAFEQAAASGAGGGAWELSRQLPGQMAFFITGVALYWLRESLNWRSLLAPAAALALGASFTAPYLEFLRPFGLGVTAVWAAVAAPRLVDAARFGDLSYGVYITHFPLIQAAVAMGLFKIPALGAAAAAASTLAMSLLLWWLVERPTLRRDSPYRATAAPEAAAA